MSSPSTATRRRDSGNCWPQRESDSSLPFHSGANSMHSREEDDKQDTSGSETSSPGGSSKDLNDSGSIGDDSDTSDEVERNDGTSKAGTDSDSSGEVDGKNESNDEGTDSDHSSDSNTSSSSGSEDSDSTDEGSDHGDINNKCDQSLNLFQQQRSLQILSEVSVSPLLPGSPVPQALKAINVFYRQFLEENGQSPFASRVCGGVQNVRGGEDLGVESKEDHEKTLHIGNRNTLDDFHGPLQNDLVAGNWCVATAVSEDSGILKEIIDTPSNKDFHWVKHSESKCPHEDIRMGIGEVNFETSINCINDSTYDTTKYNSATKSYGENEASNKRETFEGTRYISERKHDKILSETEKSRIAASTSHMGVCELLEEDLEGCSTWDRSRGATEARDGLKKNSDWRIAACGTEEVFYTPREVERGTDHFNPSRPDSTSVSKRDVTGYTSPTFPLCPARSSHQTSGGDHRGAPFPELTSIKESLINDTMNNSISVAVDPKNRLDDRNVEYLAPTQERRNGFRPEYKSLKCVSNENKSDTECDIKISSVSPKALIKLVRSPPCPTPNMIYSMHDNFLQFCFSGLNYIIQDTPLPHEEDFMRNPDQILDSVHEKITTYAQHSDWETSCLDNESKSEAVCNKDNENTSMELCFERSAEEQALSIHSNKRYSIHSGREQASSICSKERCYVSSGQEKVESIYSQELRLSSGLSATDPRHSVGVTCEQSSEEGEGNGDDYCEDGSKGSGSSDDSEADDSVDKYEENSNNSEGNSSRESEENSSDSEGSSICESVENGSQKGRRINDDRIINEEESEYCSKEKSEYCSSGNESEHNNEFHVDSKSESIEVGTSTRNVSHLNLNEKVIGDDCKVLDQQLIDDSVQKTRVKVGNEHFPCKVEKSKNTAFFVVKQQQQDKYIFESVCEENVTDGIKLNASGGSHENVVKLNSSLSDCDGCLFPLDGGSNDKPSLPDVALSETSKPRDLVTDFSCSECTFASESKSVAADSAPNIAEFDKINRNQHLFEAGTQLVPCITDTNSTPETHSFRTSPAPEKRENGVNAEDCDGDKDTSCSSDTQNRTTDEDEARTRSILGLGQHGPSVSSDSARDFLGGSEDSEQFWSSDSDEYDGYRVTNKYDTNNTKSYLEYSFKNFDEQRYVDAKEDGEVGDEGRPRELRCAGCDRVLTITVYSHLMRSKKCQNSYDMERVKLLHFEIMRLKKNAQNRYYNQRKLMSPSHRDTTKTTCLGCDKKFVAILQHLIRSVSCRDHYDYETLVKERNERSEENRVKNRKRYSETLRQERLPQNEAVLEECQGCGKKFVSLLKHLSNAISCPEAYGGREKVAAIASERRRLREQAFSRKKYLKKKKVICEKQRQYHHEHKDQIRAVKQLYRRMNREKTRERARGYYKKVQDMRPEERERRRKQALERCHKKQALAKDDSSSASQSRKKLAPDDQDAAIYLNKLTGDPRLTRKHPTEWRDEVKYNARSACKGLAAEPTDLRPIELYRRLSEEIFPKINELRQKPLTIKDEDNDGEVGSIAEVKVELDTASDNNQLANRGVRAQEKPGHTHFTKSSKSMKKPTEKNIVNSRDIKYESSKDAIFFDISSISLTTGADNPDCGRIALKRRADVSQGSEKSAQTASAHDAQSARDSTSASNVLTTNCSRMLLTSKDTRRNQLNTNMKNKPEGVVPPAGLGAAVNKKLTREGTSIRKVNAPRTKQIGMMSCIPENYCNFSGDKLHKPVDALRAECDGVPTRRLASNGTTATELCAFKHWSDTFSLPPKCTSGKKGGVKRTLESSDPSQFKTIKKMKR